MKEKYLFRYGFALLLIIGMTGLVSAGVGPQVNLVDGIYEPEEWTYADPTFAIPGDKLVVTAINSSIWQGYAGGLALTQSGGGGTMVIETTEASSCLYIQFASDKNDGLGIVYVDGEKVWEGDTWANVNLAQPLSEQKMRYLEITDLDFEKHTIVIENKESPHVTMYKIGFDRCPPEEIPEFPTIALPIAAIIGLTFLMQRRKE